MPQSTPVVRENIEWCNIWIPDSVQAELPIPRVLLIGDSISGGYGPHVRELLTGKASVAKLETSRFVTDPALMDEISMVLCHTRFDLIHFNNGLHGFDNSDESYARTFPELWKAAQKAAGEARWILAQTTPMRVSDKLDELHPFDPRIKFRNSVMQELAAKEEIPLNDLFSLVRDHPEYYSSDGVHFKDEGYEIIGRQVADEIKKVLSKTI